MNSKQLNFEPLYTLSQNQYAFPKLEAMKRELAVNQAIMCGTGKRKITSHQMNLYWKRQAYLTKEIEKLERS
jgi:hypothetical protein